MVPIMTHTLSPNQPTRFTFHLYRFPSGRLFHSRFLYPSSVRIRQMRNACYTPLSSYSPVTAAFGAYKLQQSLTRRFLHPPFIPSRISSWESSQHPAPLYWPSQRIRSNPTHCVNTSNFIWWHIASAPTPTPAAQLPSWKASKLLYDTAYVITHSYRPNPDVEIV